MTRTILGLYALACSKQHSGSPTRALKTKRTALQYGIFLLPLVLKTNETKRNKTEYVLKRNETERHDCRKRQTNGTLITVSPNKTNDFGKVFLTCTVHLFHRFPLNSLKLVTTITYNSNHTVLNTYILHRTIYTLGALSCQH